MRARGVVLAVAVGALGAAGQALPVASGQGTTGTGPTWGPVTRLAANPRGESIAVAPSGTVTVAWATGSTPPSVLVRRHPAGGSWGPPVTIGRGSDPRVAVDSHGAVTVTWLTRRHGHTDGVAAARRPAGGPWSVPVRLSRDLGVADYPHGGEEVYGATDLVLAVSPGGAAVAAWAWGSDDRAKPWRIQSAVRPAGGSWGTAVDVTPAGGARHPEVGMDARGNAVLLYGLQPFGHPQVLKARQRPAAGGWSAPVVVAREGYAHTLAVDRAGNAVVAYTPDFTSVHGTARPVAGRWETARALSPSGVATNDFALALNGRGEAAVALARDSGRVDLVRRPPGGPWSAPLRLAGPGTATVSDVLVALDDAGDTFVGWGGHALYGRYLSRSGDWGPRSTISPDAGVEVLEETAAVLAPAGDVAVLWEQEARPLKVRLTAATP